MNENRCQRQQQPEPTGTDLEAEESAELSLADRIPSPGQIASVIATAIPQIPGMVIGTVNHLSGYLPDFEAGA
jgi:hypothetical protein